MSISERVLPGKSQSLYICCLCVARLWLLERQLLYRLLDQQILLLVVGKKFLGEGGGKELNLITRIKILTQKSNLRHLMAFWIIYDAASDAETLKLLDQNAGPQTTIKQCYDFKKKHFSLPFFLPL